MPKKSSLLSILQSTDSQKYDPSNKVELSTTELKKYLGKGISFLTLHNKLISQNFEPVIREEDTQQKQDGTNPLGIMVYIKNNVKNLKPFELAGDLITPAIAVYYKTRELSGVTLAPALYFSEAPDTPYIVFEDDVMAVDIHQNSLSSKNLEAAMAKVLEFVVKMPSLVRSLYNINFRDDKSGNTLFEDYLKGIYLARFDRPLIANNKKAIYKETEGKVELMQFIDPKIPIGSGGGLSIWEAFAKSSYAIFPGKGVSRLLWHGVIASEGSDKNSTAHTTRAGIKSVYRARILKKTLWSICSCYAMLSLADSDLQNLGEYNQRKKKRREA